MAEAQGFAELPDNHLLDVTRRVAVKERESTADLIGAIAQVDARRLYLGVGYSSMYTYCREVLRLSERAAYTRITVARVAHRFPVVLELLREGSITLTTISLLGPYLTQVNHVELLEAARHKSRRDVERQVATLDPRPEAPNVVQPVLDAMPAEPARLDPLSADRFRLQVTISEHTYALLLEARDLLRHANPDGDLPAVIERGLTLLVKELRRKRMAVAEKPRVSRPRGGRRNRHIPAAIKREVWGRDGRRCAFVGTTGRCTETTFLEIHHVQPYAAGGPATAANLEVRCRAHNAYEAEQHLASTPEARAAAGEELRSNGVAPREQSATLRARRGGGTGRRSGLKIP
jgi:hypothetical protein